MHDIEKVIKGLEYCIADEYCDDCPYTDACFEIDDKPYGEYLMRDALKLLKEYKRLQELAHGYNPTECGNCGTECFCYKVLSQRRTNDTD